MRGMFFLDELRAFDSVEVKKTPNDDDGSRTARSS